MNKSQELIELVSELVRIDSVNPWLVQGGSGEGEVGRYIASWLKPLGVEVMLNEVEDGRSNLVACLPGAGGSRSLCLYAHLDTVGFSLWQDKALTPWIEGDRLYGLGAADDKGHCAAAMLVFKWLVEKRIRLGGDLWLALLIDEEGTSSGAMHFVKNHRVDAAIILEPFGLGRINITHQGFGWLDIIVKGRAAHGSAPEVGIDAILHMAEVITRLGKLDRKKYAMNPHPLNAKTVFHNSIIKGGTDYATYPSECVLGIEIGTQPGETIADRVEEIDAILHEVKSVYPNFNGAVHVNLDREPFEAQGHEALYEILATEMAKETAQKVKGEGENAWGDAALFQAAGIPTLMIGAQGDNCHSPDEWVSISELGKLITILQRTVEQFCL